MTGRSRGIRICHQKHFFCPPMARPFARTLRVLFCFGASPSGLSFAFGVHWPSLGLQGKHWKSCGILKQINQWVQSWGAGREPAKRAAGQARLQQLGGMGGCAVQALPRGGGPQKGGDPSNPKVGYLALCPKKTTGGRANPRRLFG